MEKDRGKKGVKMAGWVVGEYKDQTKKSFLCHSYYHLSLIVTDVTINTIIVGAFLCLNQAFFFSWTNCILHFTKKLIEKLSFSFLYAFNKNSRSLCNYLTSVAGLELFKFGIQSLLPSANFFFFKVPITIFFFLTHR